MTHILRNTAKALTAALPPDAPTADLAVIVTAERADGSAATLGAVTGAAGTYQATIPVGETAELDQLTLTWVAAGSSYLTFAEIVGGLLFTIPEARAFEVSDRDTPLSASADYPDAVLEEHRKRITDGFADYCGVSFTPRFARVQTSGNGKYQIPIPHHATRVISVVVDGEEVDPTTVVPSENIRRLTRTTGTWPSPPISDPTNVVVSYEHGYQAVPADIKRAALLVLLREAIRSSLPDRARTVTTELGTWDLAVPGSATPTGLPVVDEILNRYRHWPVL